MTDSIGVTGPGVVTIGETMGLFGAVDIGPRPDRYRLGIGGAESNVAIGLARLGTRATWIGRVGTDSAGDLVRRELRAEGVEAVAIVDPEAPTGLMVKHRPHGSATRVEYHRRGSAGSRLRPEDLDPDLIRDADLLHVTGITPALSPTAAAAIDHAIDLAVAAGIPVSFDINHRASLWTGRSPVETYLSIARRANILFAGEDEAALIVEGSSATDLARALTALGPSQVLVKLGAEGCVAIIDGDLITAPAIPIVPIDTVGAGDAFAAGYLAELLAGSTPTERLAIAVRAGAFACLGPGDWESLPRRGDLASLDRGADPVIR
ncbi:MAG: sugar kinase [Pseudolysinimonas sp.]